MRKAREPEGSARVNMVVYQNAMEQLPTSLAVPEMLLHKTRSDLPALQSKLFLGLHPGNDNPDQI